VVDKFRDRADGVATWICLDDTADDHAYPDLVAAGHPPAPRVEISQHDIHNVLYTSGTTGRPKGAMISHGAAAVRGLRLAQWFGLTADDGFVGWLPLFHCGGDESRYATMITGGRYATLRKADAETMFPDDAGPAELDLVTAEARMRGTAPNRT